MLTDAIRQAQKLHREVVDQTYNGLCSVFQKVPVKDPVTKVTSYKEVAVLMEHPCRLSYSSTAVTTESDTVSTAAQTIKLFLAPEVLIEPGCRIEVTQNGRTESYSRSGKAAVYSSHQEVLLELWKGYA